MIFIYRVQVDGQMIHLRMTDTNENARIRLSLAQLGYMTEFVEAGECIPDLRTAAEVRQAIDLINLVY